jgi:phosphatidylglycerol---prolipoprotein diacylglyceryl transferase
MHPVLCKIGLLTLYSYGLMVSLGFLAGIGSALVLAGKKMQDRILDLAFFVLIFSIVGARIFYVIEFWRDFTGNPLSALFIWEGGLVFYGGMTFGIATIYFYSRFTKISPLKLLDIITPGVALGYAFGRIGCFLRGCCYGAETDLPWAVHFPDISGTRHPTQIYASLSGLLIFIVLLLIFRKKKFDGQVFSAGLMLYSVYRFLIEFIRVNPQYLLGLSEAQLGSAVVFLIGAVIYWGSRRKKV